MPMSDDDDEAHPVGGEVAGGEAGEHVERRAALVRRVTTSRTCAELVDVKTLTTSGMIAPASVPHVMMVESFHHSVPSPRSGMSRYDTTKVMTTETIEVSHTRDVSGASKFILAAFA